MLKGFKTLIAAALVIIGALIGLFSGTLPVNVFLETVFGALNLASLRDAVKKVEVLVGVKVPPMLLKWSFLPNLKTYLTAAFVVLTAVLAYMNGEQSMAATIAVISAAIGSSTLRRAIQRVQVLLGLRKAELAALEPDTIK